MKEKIVKPKGLEETHFEKKIKDEIINAVGRDMNAIGIRNHCRVELDISLISITPIFKC